MESAAVNYVDIFAALVLLVGLLGGLKRGLSGELSRAAGYVIAFYAAWHFVQPAAEFLRNQTRIAADHSVLAAFIGILIAAFLISWGARVLLRNIMEFAFKGRIERVGGALCGLIKSAVIVAAAILMASFLPAGNFLNEEVQTSFSGRLVLDRVRPLYENLQQKMPGLNLPGGLPAEDGSLGLPGEVESQDAYDSGGLGEE